MSKNACKPKYNFIGESNMIVIDAKQYVFIYLIMIIGVVARPDIEFRAAKFFFYTKP